MINRDQYVRAEFFDFRSEFGELLAISKVSAKQDHTASKGVQDATTILCI
jgi:hypothetical protein